MLFLPSIHQQQRNWFGLLCLLIQLVALPHPGHADISGQQNELGTLVVTATRTTQPLNETSQTVAVISRKDIENAPGDSLYDLLEQVSGVDVRQRGSHGIQADVSIRGSSFEQTLVLVNGLRVSNPQTGHHNLDIPFGLDDIERIEIIKGPGARLYGANAMAGVINIITRAGQQSPLSFRLDSGENEYLALHGSAVTTTGSWQHRLAAGHQYSSGFDENEPTGFNTKTFNYQTSGEIAGKLLETGLAYTDKDFGASRYYFDASGQKERTTSWLGYVTANLDSGSLHWRPSITYNRHEDCYRYQYGDQWYENSSDTDRYSLDLQANGTSRLGKTSFGYTGDWEQITSSSLGDHARNQHSLFLNHRIRLLQRLTLGGGLSAVYASKWGWEYWPGAEMNLELQRNLHWFASVAKSFRIPTYTEMYYSTPSNIGDPDLNPEQSWTWETGLRWQQGRLKMEASLFYRDSDDLIDWARTSETQPWQVRNVAESETTGIELGCQLREPLSFFRPLEQISFSYTYLDVNMDSQGLETKYSLNNLRHQAHAGLLFAWWPTVKQSLKMRYEKRLLGDSVTVVDSRLSWQIDPHWQTHVTATNLLDEKGIEAGFVPLPGRWLIAGVTWRY
ncbi:MAG: TonB-dependent receptor [Desulfuromonadaceae bacterium]|nr:TonB-dependent receptor [Desulfuromonadaceae bacterium]